MDKILSFLVYWVFNPSVPFWTMVTGVLTFLLVLVAYSQLKSIFKTSSADFIHRFKNDFFTAETRKIIKLIDQNKLKFIPKTGDFSNGISSYNMDDLVLGHFEDLGVFEKRGYIDIEIVYDFFDYYIELCWENPEVQKYLNQLSGGSDIYENFRYIYKKCKSFGEAKKSGISARLWKTKWRLYILNPFK